MGEYAAGGVEEVMVMPIGSRPDVWLEERLGPVVGRLAELGKG